MSSIVEREQYLIKLCQWDNGDWFADVFPIEGDYEGVAIVSTGECRTREEVMVEVARRLYGDLWRTERKDN